MTTMPDGPHSTDRSNTLIAEGSSISKAVQPGGLLKYFSDGGCANAPTLPHTTTTSASSHNVGCDNGFGVLRQNSVRLKRTDFSIGTSIISSPLPPRGGPARVAGVAVRGAGGRPAP